MGHLVDHVYIWETDMVCVQVIGDLPCSFCGIILRELKPQWETQPNTKSLREKTEVTALSESAFNFYYFPGGSHGKESACNVGDPSSIPGLGKSCGEGNGNQLQYSCLENFMDREAWRVIVHGITVSWTWLRDFQFTIRLPLRYSCPTLLPLSVYMSVSTCICMCIFVSSPMPSKEAELRVKEGTGRSSQVTLQLSFLALNKTTVLPLVAWQMCGCAEAWPTLSHHGDSSQVLGEGIYLFAPQEEAFLYLPKTEKKTQAGYSCHGECFDIPPLFSQVYCKTGYIRYQHLSF